MGGHLEAMVRLAKLELIGFAPAKAIFGDSGTPNHTRSRMWAERAAAAGLPEGKAVLALILEHGGTGPKTEILRLLEESAAAEDPSACLQLAIRQLKDRGGDCDRTRVASLINIAAKKELPQALYLFGIIKNLGFGCIRDDDHALVLFERSASRGSIYGMARHGAAMIAGEPKPHDLVTGETWLRRAALAGHGAAASMIGALRAGQDGLPPNFHEAFAWFQKAGTLHDSFGAKAQGLLSYLGYGDCSKREVVLALLNKSRFLAKRPTLDPASLFVAGGVSFAFTIKASKWFASQARTGDRKAVLGLASCMAFGMEGGPDHAATLHCLKGGPLSPSMLI
jgi:TPR repeat protein